MVKVITLLEKMGLVTRSEEAPVAPTEPAASELRVSAPPPSSPPIQPAPPPLVLDEAALGEVAGEEDYALEKVYASASIQDPASGFTVYRLIEMLDAEELRGLDAPTRAKVISGMLRRLPSGPVDVNDIVRDAALRDRALDAFERFLADRMARSEREVAEKNRALQQEIDELTVANTEQMEVNQKALETERARFERWRARKRAEEDRLFAAVAPFVESNPVTRDGTAPASAGDSPLADRQ